MRQVFGGWGVAAETKRQDLTIWKPHPLQQYKIYASRIVLGMDQSYVLTIGDAFFTKAVSAPLQIISAVRLSICRAILKGVCFYYDG